MTEEVETIANVGAIFSPKKLEAHGREARDPLRPWTSPKGWSQLWALRDGLELAADLRITNLTVAISLA